MEVRKKQAMKISLVRGGFLNPFELQNYYPLLSQYDIQAISSKRPLDCQIKMPLVQLWSPTDLPVFPFKFPLLNRLLIDAHYLYNLENTIKGSDIVHVAETYYHYTIQAIKAKQKGLVKKVISTVWEVIPHNNEGIWGRKRFKKLSYQYIDHFLAVTHLAKAALLEEGIEDKRITVVPMGVNLARFHPSPPQEESEAVNILFVGRLVPEKGIGDLVWAFSRLREKNKNINLTIVGRGPLKNNYSHLPGVILKQVPYHKIHQLYQKADIFCLPCRTINHWQEQFGMVLVEAMASGLPIVTTSTGAINQVCGPAALYCQPKNPPDLQKTLKRLIYNQSLPEKLGLLARQRAEKYFDHRQVAKKISQIYQKVLCP